MNLLAVLEDRYYFLSTLQKGLYLYLFVLQTTNLLYRVTPSGKVKCSLELLINTWIKLNLVLSHVRARGCLPREIFLNLAWICLNLQSRMNKNVVRWLKQTEFSQVWILMAVWWSDWNPYLAIFGWLSSASATLWHSYSFLIANSGEIQGNFPWVSNPFPLYCLAWGLS